MSLHRARGDQLSARQLHDLLRLRVDIFVVEQNCPYHEIDGRDLEPDTCHLWWADEAGPYAAVRILDQGDARRVGRVVVRRDRRGEGLGRLIMEAAHAEIGDRTPVVLDGQSHLRSFYESLGYVITGPEYPEDGIPHLPMRRAPAGIGS